MLSIPGSALGVTGLTAPLLATAVLLCVLSIGLVVVSMPLHFSFSFSNDSKLASACSRSISNLFIFCCRAFSAFNTAEGSIELSSVLEGPPMSHGHIWEAPDGHIWKASDGHIGKAPDGHIQKAHIWKVDDCRIWMEAEC